MSPGLSRLLRRAERLRPVQVLRGLKRPFAVWPILAWFARPFRRQHSIIASHSSHGPRLKKPLPAWSLLIVLLLGTGLGYYSSTLLSQVAGTASTPDFTLGVAPSAIIVPQGSFASITVQISSLNSFAGSVDLNATIFPPITNSTLALNPSSVSLFTGTASPTLTITIPASAQVRTYTLQITGTSGRMDHGVTAIIEVSLPPPPDFQMTASPSSMNITQGSAGTSTITLTSIGGFSGIISLSATSTPSSGSSPVLSVNPNRVTVLSGGTANVVVNISTSSTTTRGSYSIVVQGISGNLSNTVTVSVNVQ